MCRKTRKRKSLVLSFTEEARFRRTGAIFLCFSDNGGKHEASTWCESRTEGGVKKKKKAKPAVPCTLYTVPTPIVQAIFPQIPAETAANMVLCRDNIFSKEMYASMRAKPMRR